MDFTKCHVNRLWNVPSCPGIWPQFPSPSVVEEEEKLDIGYTDIWWILKSVIRLPARKTFVQGLLQYVAFCAHISHQRRDRRVSARAHGYTFGTVHFSGTEGICFPRFSLQWPTIGYQLQTLLYQVRSVNQSLSQKGSEVFSPGVEEETKLVSIARILQHSLSLHLYHGRRARRKEKELDGFILMATIITLILYIQ